MVPAAYGLFIFVSGRFGRSPGHEQVHSCHPCTPYHMYPISDSVNVIPIPITAVDKRGLNTHCLQSWTRPVMPRLIQFREGAVLYKITNTHLYQSHFDYRSYDLLPRVYSTQTLSSAFCKNTAYDSGWMRSGSMPVLTPSIYSSIHHCRWKNILYQASSHESQCEILLPNEKSLVTRNRVQQ